MNHSIEEWDRQARASQALAEANRREAIRMRRERRYFTVAAVVTFALAVGLLWVKGAYAVTWHRSVASVYDSSPQTASGRHAYLMVANRWLQFGTRVRFLYHHRKATALVLDRGPFGAGRDFDLNYGVQHALGFPFGVDTVAWRVVR